MKVRDLKRQLEEADDNAEVLLSMMNRPDSDKELVNTGTTKRPVMRLLWGDLYNTREVQNAYCCNDDRYGGPAFLIEAGVDSP